MTAIKTERDQIKYLGEKYPTLPLGVHLWDELSRVPRKLQSPKEHIIQWLTGAENVITALFYKIV